jgi:hypothetical protein
MTSRPPEPLLELHQAPVSPVSVRPSIKPQQKGQPFTTCIVQPWASQNSRAQHFCPQACMYRLSSSVFDLCSCLPRCGDPAEWAGVDLTSYDLTHQSGLSRHIVTPLCMLDSWHWAPQHHAVLHTMLYGTVHVKVLRCVSQQ